MFRPVVFILACGVPSTTALGHEAAPATVGAEVTFKGSTVCDGACVPDPSVDDHVKVMYAIDVAANIRAEMDVHLHP